jgi:hypothetical protein
MYGNYEYNTDLQYKVKALDARVRSFESGQKYVRMREATKAQLAEKDREIRSLKRELADAYAQTIDMRKHWLEVFDDLEKAHSKELQEKDRRIKAQDERIREVERQRDEALDKLRDKRLELYDVGIALEDERGKNIKLTAQVNRDFENSSLPSSMMIARKPITNSREKTGRKPGGQIGHDWHPRKMYEPTESHEIPAPDEYANNPEYELTDLFARRQNVKIFVGHEVTEYYTAIFRHKKTGALVHADFPAGYENEVNYDGSVKAFAFLLGNECNVSHDKTRSFISELTGGEIELSKGMLNGLTKEFSSKTEAELKESVKTILASPVVNIDFTNGNVGGKSAQILIGAAPGTSAALFIAREHKGHEGVKGTPLEGYQGILIHDHELTFYSYGTGHQECMQHNCRYLKGSIENEKALTWNTKMQELVREMLHWRKGLGENDELDKDIVAAFEKRYDEILEIAREEYEYEPPSKYYKEGYNLYKRLVVYKENELLFLHDKRVPANNSLCERLARLYKRKQKQAMTFRSFESLGYLCNSLSVLYTLRTNGKNTFEQVTEIFNRPRPKKAEILSG